jgi:hypothetical protein
MSNIMNPEALDKLPQVKTGITALTYNSALVIINLSVCGESGA